MRLYDLAFEYRRALDALDEKEPKEEIARYLDQLKGQMGEKLDSIIKYRAELLSAAKMQKLESMRLKELAGSNYKKAEKLLEYVKDQFDQAGLKKWNTTTHQLSLVEAPPKVHVEDISQVPESFIRTWKEVKRKDIRDMLLKGVTVSWARLIHKKTLRIR